MDGWSAIGSPALTYSVRIGVKTIKDEAEHLHVSSGKVKHQCRYTSNGIPITN